MYVCMYLARCLGQDRKKRKSCSCHLTLQAANYLTRLRYNQPGIQMGIVMKQASMIYYVRYLALRRPELIPLSLNTAPSHV